jgi:dTDP-4-dehydrorhamnose 3,5-epimerase-like enzyme
MQPKIIEGSSVTDERGRVSFVNNFDFKNVKRFYVVENHKRGFVRAWHGHKKEAKYAFVASGVALIGIQPFSAEHNQYEDLKTYVLTETKPEILYIPPGHYNGFKTLAPNTRVVFFSTSTLEESKDDDFRHPAKRWDIWEELWR